MIKCDFCQEEVWGGAILGIMPPNQTEDRKIGLACDKCMDTCPCGSKGSWMDGLITCEHGFVYDNDYLWEKDFPFSENETARLFFKFQKRKWWSYLKISNNNHFKMLLFNCGKSANKAI